MTLPFRATPGALRPLLRLLLALLAVALAPASSSAQIVNTLGGWDDEEPGWSGRIGLTGSLSGGNTDVKSGKGAARVQWQDDTWRWRALGSFTVEEANGARAKEESLTHLRVSRPGDGSVAPFAFAQGQRNPFRRLETRLLLGAGAAFELRRTEKSVFVFGFSPMVEFEKIRDEEETTRGRLSTFLRIDADFSEGVSLALLGFFQPRLAEPEDFRVSTSAELSTRIVGPLAFLVSGSYERDDQPPENVEPDDWSVDFGVTLDL